MSEQAQFLDEAERMAGGVTGKFPEIVDCLDDEDFKALARALEDPKRVSHAAIAKWIKAHPDIPERLHVNASTVKNWRSKSTPPWCDV